MRIAIQSISSVMLPLFLHRCFGFSELASPSSADALAAARTASNFLERVLKAFPFGPESFLCRSENADFDYGVVYAALGQNTIQKASVSATSVRNTLGLDVGTLLVTSEFGLASLAPQAEAYGTAFWWDYVMSVDGFGINFTSLPEFEAFTIAKSKSSSTTDLASTYVANRKTESERRGSKFLAWAAVRQLRSAKMAALLLAQEVFKVATIFLDADTLVCDSLLSVFKVVLPSGPWFAFVPAPSEHHSLILQRMYGIQKGDVPPEPNTGIVAISNCDGARRVLKRWNEVYWHESLALGSIQNPMDQPPLRAALYLEDASWISLNKVFNCRGHVKNVNAALPMRCGGFDAAHWDSLARSSILEAVGTAQLRGASLSLAQIIQGGIGCTVLHSHAVPRAAKCLSGFQSNALVVLDEKLEHHRLFGFGLEKISDALNDGGDLITRAPLVDSTISTSQPHAIIAIFHLPISPKLPQTPVVVQDASDWRRGSWRNQTVVVGPMSKDACATVLMPCAIVLVLINPLVQLTADGGLSESKDFFQKFERGLHIHDSQILALRRHARKLPLNGGTLLDALLPLDASDLGFVDDPRANRVDRYGIGGDAEVADAVARLKTDNFLVLLADDPQNSRIILNAAFKTRSDARTAALHTLDAIASFDIRGRESLKALNQSSRRFLRRLLFRDMLVYGAAARLFDAQYDAARRKNQ